MPSENVVIHHFRQANALRSFLLPLLGVWLLGSCWGDRTTAPPEPATPIPSSIVVSPATATLAALGKTVSLTAEVRDQYGNPMPAAAVIWSSSEPSVATVDPNGLVTAVANGSASIAAQAGSAAGSASVRVQQAPATISLAPDSLTFDAVGDTATLAAMAADANGHAIEKVRVVWTSGDAAVATVDSTGLVTTVGNGSTAIMATSDSIHARAVVGVQQVLATLSLAPESLAFEGAGDTATVMAVAADANGYRIPGMTAAWVSRDASVASIDPAGLVTAIRPGYTQVTATVDSLTASAEVAVFDISSDRDVLEFLYRTTGGDGWRDNTNWLTNAPLSEWAGVTTYRNGRVRYLELRDNNLKGRMPRSLGRLDELFILSLDDNSLRGGIPPEFGALRALRDLYLSRNELSGPLPPEMGNMEGLRNLSVSRNDLSGPVPETFARLNLTRLYMGRTHLCLPRGLNAWYESIEQTDRDPLKCIPATADREALVVLYEATGGPAWDENDNWLSDLSINTWTGVTTNEDGHVTALVLVDNNLNGALPPEIGDLLHLERLRLSDNSLSGTMPPEIGRLGQVRFLSLGENQLEGPIPPEIGGLVSVDTLFLSHNNLSGPIPSEIGNLESLERLALHNNQLTGPLPSSLGNLKNLVNLGLSDNRINGPLPREIGDMAALEYFSIYRNRVSGALPPELGKLKALKELAVSRNQLTGRIPPELGDLTSLEGLFLSRNSLSRAIPPELGRLSNLEYLWLFENLFSGEIPPELGQLAKLKQLLIGYNPLTGHIPPELGQLPALVRLYLNKTNLTGPIPPELGQLPSLTSLELCESTLSGPIPAELGDIRTLQYLHLCYNPELSGLLPRSLMNLEMLSELIFYQTELCSPIDREFQAWLAEVQAQGGECEPAEVERLALGEFFARTGGDSWTNRTGWNRAASLNSWHGVTFAAGRVRELVLPANGLRGPLAPEIGNLTELRTLNLGDNQLSGEFPVVIASMDALDVIRVSGNRQMDGRLPFRLTELRGLQALSFANTGLCASPSDTFQRWLGGLQVADGATCSNPEQVTLSLPVVYLTQAIQRPAGDVPLIQGRNAFLRVFLESEESLAFFEPEVVATFSLGGREVHRVVMQRDGDVLSTSTDEGDLRSSYNAVIPGSYIVPGTELVVQADPGDVVPLAPTSETRFPASGAEPLNVVEVPPMELTVVPVVEVEQPDYSIYGWTNNIADNSREVGLFRYAFPFSEFRARSRETYFTSLDLTDEDDQWRLVLELEVVRAAENGQGYWYGAAASKNGYVRGRARLGGWVSMGKAWNTELAHEVGHNLNLEHAPCGGALGTDPEYPYPNGSIGVWGYDFRDGSVVSPDRRRDIMGYCYEQGWLSDYYFEKVIDYREKAEALAARVMAAAPPRSETLVLWGGVVDGELRIEPPFSMTTTPRLPEDAGPYRLEAVGSGGQTEFSLAFTPGEDKFGDKYFFFTVPIEADWAESLDRLTLTGPEGTVTVSAADERTISVVTDPATGRIRSILRDWEEVLPGTLQPASPLTVTTVRGLGDAVRLRR